MLLGEALLQVVWGEVGGGVDEGVGEGGPLLILQLHLGTVTAGSSSWGPLVPWGPTFGLHNF